jgi:tellurite resistance protein TerC
VRFELASLPVLIAKTSGVERLNLHVSGAVWVAVGLLIVALLLFDLLVVNRQAHVPTLKRAALQVAFWTVVGVAFGAGVFAKYGSKAGSQWFAGYLIELSLSIDNVFVWALILSYFAVPRAFQHRVLFWGIFGAIALRAIFIFAGVALLEAFEPLLIVFGVFLLYTAWKLFTDDETHELEPEKNLFLRAVRRLVPSSTEYDGQKLFTRQNGKRLATPLLAVLVLVESTDVLFAVDSVPAILGVSREQFIVLTSNAFAILGLRALYFLFSDIQDRFAYLQQGLALILALVGVKMILDKWVHIPTWVSLVVIAVVLLGSVLFSMAKTSGQTSVSNAAD